MKRLLNEHEAAGLLGVSVYKLRSDRYKHRGLRYVKIGTRVMYRPEDIEALIEAHTITPRGAE